MSGIGFFLIAEGEAEVSVDGDPVARLGKGDYFGELGLIGNRARMATVTALTPLTCLVMATWDLEELVNPALRRRGSSSATRRPAR